MIDFQSLVPSLRSQFPSLLRRIPDRNECVIYLDGPAGSQVPESVVHAISDYYLHHNANSAGTFATSQETNQLMAAAHQAAADWFGAEDARECIFGANMTTLTFAFSRALSKTWNAGDRIVVTELDHDANVTPWRLAAEDRGVGVEVVRVCRDNATLDEIDFEQKVIPGTKLVAITAASNSVGSATRLRELIAHAHRVGAEVYVDAVHWAPHRLIEVQRWNADFCVCSAYKFFGPHVGMLWGRLARLEELAAYKLRPSPSQSPGKWMTGTQNFAAIAGVLAAIDYMADIGRALSTSAGTPGSVETLPRREALGKAFVAIQEYEMRLLERLVAGLMALDGVTVFGITDASRFNERVPTVAFTIANLPSQEVALRLAKQGVYSWSGNYYAVDICNALGQQAHGMVRLGILHTTTLEEIERTLEAVRSVIRSIS